MDEPRPPYVEFEDREVEDREATMANGYYTAKSVHFALITPPGTKDVVEKNAEDWLRDIAQAAHEGRMPSTWVEAYKHKFQLYKQGLEIPEDGTPIANWPLISKAQVRNILSANIRTVEDLAEATDTALSLLGMGSAALRDQARNWVRTAKDKGKVTAEVTTLQQENKDLRSQLETQADQITKLNDRLNLLTKETA